MERTDPMTISKNIRPAVFVLLIGVSFLSAQDSVDTWSFRLGTRYSGYDLSDAARLFSTVLTVYQQVGIPVKKQVLYPSSYGLTAGYTYSVMGNIETGLIVGYGTTTAVSRYGDIAGSIDIDSDIRFTDISFVILFTPKKEWRVHPQFQLSFGQTYVTYLLDQKTFDERDHLLSRSYVRATGSFTRGAGSAGIAIDVKNVTIAVNGGMHLGSADDLEGESQLDGTVTSNGTFPLKIDITGVDIGLDVAFHF